MSATVRWVLALTVGVLLGLAGCAQPSASRSDLNPLFRGTSGAGEYEFDPATLPKPRPRSPAEAERPPACDHVWQADDRAMHSFIDPLTGMPAICVPIRCLTCGEVRHECLRKRGR